MILASLSSKDGSAPQGGRRPAASTELSAGGEDARNPASPGGVAKPEGQTASPGKTAWWGGALVLGGTCLLLLLLLPDNVGNTYRA